jgi:hypothetical protein
MSKHTKGPWEAFTEPEFSDWWAIRQVTADGLNHEVGSCDGGFEEADARLMASAPDLLEAAEMAKSVMILMGWENDPTTLKLSRAIKKAKGEE